MEQKNSTLYVIARIIQFIIAGVFIVAALSKALDPPAFVDQIAAYGIFPQLAPFGAWFFIVFECILAGMLLVNLYPRIGQTASAGLLLMFSGVTAYAVFTGALSNCGCFGNIMPRTPEQTLVEDLIMVAALVFSTAVTWKRKTSAGIPKYIFTGALGVAGALVGVFHLSIPADDLATQLKPGSHFTAWPVEGLYDSLNTGTHVVFLFSLEMENADKRIQRMNEIAQSKGIESAIGLITDGSGQLTTLMFQYGASFPAGAIEPRFARNLYRKLPRTFILKNGKVAETWSEIPAPSEVLNALNTKIE